VTDGPLLEIRGLEKAFGATRALRPTDLDVRAGEIHSLVGQNGSGKSTLIKLLSGFHEPDGGAVTVRGRLSFQHQDLALAEGLTVLENLRLGRYETTWYGRLPWRRERRVVREMLAGVGLERLDPDTPLRDVPQAERALIGFARALHDVREHGGVLVLDEPTVALPSAAVQRLFAAVRAVVAAGAGVLFVSHRLEEVLGLSDRISVLRDGRLVATLAASEATDTHLVELMLGRELGELYPAPPPAHGEEVLSVRALRGRAVDGLDLAVGRGEIVGLTGLVGMGQDEVPYLLFGADRRSAGELWIGGRRWDAWTPEGLRRAGIVLLPADRRRRSGSPAATVMENVSLPVLGQFARGGRVRRAAELAAVRELLVRFDVRPADPGRPLGQLSGGNQQKALLAKWLQTRPRVLLLHDPTQGVDIGSRQQIFRIIREVAEEGVAVVVASAEHEDLAHMCHRVVVMRRGRPVAAPSGSELSSERIVEHCYLAAA
jgi:ribose transport system ATP-binding protein